MQHKSIEEEADEKHFSIVLDALDDDDKMDQEQMQLRLVEKDKGKIEIED